MVFEITILGSSSATPTNNRHHTSQYIQIDDNYILVDCGEGTQSQLKRYDIKLNKIDHIFISHLHGDHYLGLVGLISSMHLNGRKDKLHIYGPAGLAEIITIQLKYSDTRLVYNIQFHEIRTTEVYTLLDNASITIDTIPLNHRINCAGFLFKEKPKRRRIIKEKLPENFSLQNISKLKRGFDIVDEHGKLLYKNQEFTLEPKKSRSYAYCSDTCYSESVIELVQMVDLLYHEATFLHDLKNRATETYHTTALEAGMIAKKAKVNKLIIGHFSSRYKDLNLLLNEARIEYKNTELAIEGTKFSIEE